jgi:hypothetical protein
MSRRVLVVLYLTLSAVALAPRPADAIPAFARKYETSCLTCHTVYPKLTPFGEAFRRNGYRFPGVDGDYVKMPAVPLGQEANKKTFPRTAWPSSLPGGSVLALGVNGQAFAYPDSSASSVRAGGSHGAGVSLDQLVQEGHVWAGAALDDSITLWAEVTFGEGAVDVEHAQVLLNDLLGPRHALNLTVGRGFPTLTSFGPHSTYLGDSLLTVAPVTGIYGVSGDPFTLVDNYNGAELTSVLGGRLDWSAGVTSGKNPTTDRVRSENVYGHAGVKLGGMRLDGEGLQGPANALRPWAETALTVDVFAFRSREMLGGIAGADIPLIGDTSYTFGAAARGQVGSTELNLGAYTQKHDRATAEQGGVRADVEWAELSQVVFPWMVPAVRVERIGLMPTGAPNVSDVHVMPGIAFLLRANVKAVLVGNLEFTDGFPQVAGSGVAWDGGNAGWGNLVAAPKAPASPGAKLNELESIALFLAWAM